MATTYTSLLGFALPTTGELSGTWGDTVNNSITSLVESSIAGNATANVTSSDWTLTTTGSGAANQARMAILIPTGTPGTTRNIIAPSQSKAYVVLNKSNSNIVVKGSSTSGANISSGVNALVAWDGSDFATIASTYYNPGTVTSMSVVTANGFGGSVANATSTPAITINTSVNGIAKGNGTAFSAAVAGTDYVAPGNATTFTAKQTFTNTAIFSGSTGNVAASIVNAVEPVTVSATAATGTINFDVTTQSVLYYTANASANWVVNLRGNSSTTLDSLMNTGDSLTSVFLVTQGSTAYYNTSVQVDGTTSGVTTKWANGSTPAAGVSSAINSYTYTAIKTGSATFTVIASLGYYA